MTSQVKIVGSERLAKTLPAKQVVFDWTQGCHLLELLEILFLDHVESSNEICYHKFSTYNFLSYPALAGVCSGYLWGWQVNCLSWLIRNDIYDRNLELVGSWCLVPQKHFSTILQVFGGAEDLAVRYRTGLPPIASWKVAAFWADWDLRIGPIQRITKGAHQKNSYFTDLYSTFIFPVLSFAILFV